MHWRVGVLSAVALCLVAVLRVAASDLDASGMYEQLSVYGYSGSLVSDDKSALGTCLG